jgi:hypothetical protein
MRKYGVGQPVTRLDLAKNRQLGRACLAHLYWRYGNWPDAIAADNWGPGNMDWWIASGRPISNFPLDIERYRNRVLRDVGFDGTANHTLFQGTPQRPESLPQQPRSIGRSRSRPDRTRSNYHQRKGPGSGLRPATQDFSLHVYVGTSRHIEVTL